jgi:hypothetical protein
LVEISPERVVTTSENTPPDDGAGPGVPVDVAVPAAGVRACRVAGGGCGTALEGATRVLPGTAGGMGKVALDDPVTALSWSTP